MIIEILIFASALCPASKDWSELFFVGEVNEVIVEDAQRRWAEYVNDESAVAARFPIVIKIQDERCVMLQLKPEYIGPSPVFCYKLNSDEFTRWDKG